jgi:MFS family permease
MLVLRGDAAWREAWIALAGLSAVLTVLSISGARRIDDPVTTRASVTWPVRELGAALASYFMFGVGYIGYMTFIVASMVGRGASHLDVAATWGTLGAAVMVAPLVWRIPRSRWNASRMLVIVGTVLTVGSAIPLYTVARPAMIVSAFLFGIAMFSVPATITDLVKASLAKAAWGSAIAFFTLLFAVGQILGPLLTGWLADATHGLDGGLAGSTGVLLLASVVAMYQRQTAAATMPPSARERVAAR